jgi:hypothetical protein
MRYYFGLLFFGIGLCGLLAALSVNAPADSGKTVSQPTENRIVLRSPNGRYELALIATNDAAGIWVTDTTNGKISCVYNDQNEGPVVAVGNTKADGYRGWHAALVVDSPPGRGRVQLNPHK